MHIFNVNFLYEYHSIWNPAMRFENDIYSQHPRTFGTLAYILFRDRESGRLFPILFIPRRFQSKELHFNFHRVGSRWKARISQSSTSSSSQSSLVGWRYPFVRPLVDNHHLDAELAGALSSHSHGCLHPLPSLSLQAFELLHTLLNS